MPVAPLHDLVEFRRLSASISYVLAAATGSAERILDLILAGRPPPAGHEQDLVELIDYVVSAWAGSRRRLGPSAALHPLRATALLVQAFPRATPIDFAVMLLHDKVEDVSPETRAAREWAELEDRFLRLVRQFDPDGRHELASRLRALARGDRGESYCAYLGRLIDFGNRNPDILRAKLADRLDNTLDFSIDFRDPLDEADFFQQVFECLFLPGWRGPASSGHRRPSGRLDLARRLYGLYKNVVLLSLVRSGNSTAGGVSCAILMDAIVEAGLREAQRIGLELLADRLGDVAPAGDMLRDAMEYCHSGRAFRVTEAAAGHVLDGLLVSTFDTPDPEARGRRLQALSGNDRLLFQGAVTFLAIFSAFGQDPAFFVRGIDPDGIHPGR